MRWSKEWVEHSPDLAKCIRENGEQRAEADCPCGVSERHTHCKGCGLLLCKGDWDAPGLTIGTLRVRRDGELEWLARGK